MVLSSRGLKMTLPRISGAAITRQLVRPVAAAPASEGVVAFAPPACLCRANQAGRAAARRHQPEAQHPNFPPSTSWQADYPIFAPKWSAPLTVDRSWVGN